MRLPRFRVGTLMAAVVVVGLDLFAIVQRFSDPLAYFSTAATCAVVLFSVPMLVLVAVVDDA
ncbi:MAG: hypothetical protein P4L84_07895 [Isosphaeraceae bacterium]|nr:hypothetical protein [Isosphaeraceae bacterium]